VSYTWAILSQQINRREEHRNGGDMSSNKLEFEAKWADLPALRAGGNGSRMARMNAEIRTFCRIWGWRCWAILPRHTVVLVLMPPCKNNAQFYQTFNTPVTPPVACSSPGHPWIAAWQSGASPPRSDCCSSAWEQDESPTATSTDVSKMHLASNTLISTEKPIYLDRLLSNGWVCVHEAMCYMGEDLVIYCGCLQMSCQQSHMSILHTIL